MSDVLLWDLVYNVISMWEIFGLQARMVISSSMRPRIIIIDWAILSSQNITSKRKGLMGHV